MARASKRRRSCTAAGCLCGLACISWLPLLLVTDENEQAVQPVPQPPQAAEDVLLVSHAPGRCRGPQATYYATKATQTKLHLAQRRGWRVWVAGDESDALASSAALAPVADGSDTAAAVQLGLLTALQNARPPARWLLWLDPDLLVTNPEVELPFAQYEADGVDLVLWGEDRDSGLVVDAGVLALRVGPWAAELLTAALDLARPGGARVGASASALLGEVIGKASRWRRRTRLERGVPLVASWQVVVPLLPAPDARLPLGTLAAPLWGSDRVPFATSFRGCSLCDGAASSTGTSADGGEQQQPPPPSATSVAQRSQLSACRGALMLAFTHALNFALAPMGAQHAVQGSTHVRPAADGSGNATGGGGAAPRWLIEHRGGLARCLPSLVVVGSQRGGLASLHRGLRQGAMRGRVRLHGGEREQHFFSMDNRFKLGLLHHARQFYPNASSVRSCGGTATAAAATAAVATAAQQGSRELFAEVSSSYLDYPKARGRIFGVMPRVRVVALLREPVARSLSAFNVRWLTWLCGKLIWSRRDCWAAVTGEAAVRANQVGPFQMHAALKLWRSCTGGGDGKEGAAPSLKCLKADYASKLRNKTAQELGALRNCAASGGATTTTTTAAAQQQTPGDGAADGGGDGGGGGDGDGGEAGDGMPAAGAAVAAAGAAGDGVAWSGCLELEGPMVGPKQLHKKMEDGAFVYRSMYAVHVRGWLQYFPAEQLLLLDAAELWATERRRRDGAMGRIVAHLGLPPQPAQAEGHAEAPGWAHENGRQYLLPPAEQPPEVGRQLRAWLAPYNCALAALVRLHRLASNDLRELPWLQAEMRTASCSTP